MAPVVLLWLKSLICHEGSGDMFVTTTNGQFPRSSETQVILLTVNQVTIATETFEILHSTVLRGTSLLTTTLNQYSIDKNQKFYYILWGNSIEINYV